MSNELLSFGQPGWGGGAGGFESLLGGAAGGMNPLVLMSLLQGGGTLLNTLFSGLLEGAGISEERKYKEGIWAKKKAETKPSQPFYMTPYLAGYDKVLMKAVLSNLANKGQGYGEGLNLESIMAMMSGSGTQQAPQKAPLQTGKYAGLARQYG